VRVLDLIEELRRLVDALEGAGVEFAVCGGLAVAIHARPRATLDVDILVPRPALEPAKGAARSVGYRIEAAPMILSEGRVEMHRLSKPDPATGDLLSVDLLAVTPVLAAVWASRERVAWQHGSIPVVSRAGLVAMTRLRASGQDLDDIRALEGDDAEG
jgi:hypothetical protein